MKALTSALLANTVKRTVPRSNRRFAFNAPINVQLVQTPQITLRLASDRWFELPNGFWIVFGDSL